MKWKGKALRGTRGEDKSCATCEMPVHMRRYLPDVGRRQRLKHLLIRHHVRATSYEKMNVNQLTV